jgi:arylsulfatase A
MFRGDVIKPWHAGSPGALRGWKAQTWEGGVRVPFIVRWTGRIPAGRVEAGMGSLMDVYATTLRLAGATLPSDRKIDGLDLSDWLMGRGESPRRNFFYFRENMLEAVRDGRWKLRVSNHGRLGASAGEPAIPELYDLEVDPSERYDLAAQHPDVVSRLRGMMQTAAGEITASSR